MTAGAAGDDECGSACLGRPPNKWEDHSSLVKAGWQLQMDDWPWCNRLATARFIIRMEGQFICFAGKEEGAGVEL
jgi:hypothetical protein